MYMANRKTSFNLKIGQQNYCGVFFRQQLNLHYEKGFLVVYRYK